MPTGAPTLDQDHRDFIPVMPPRPPTGTPLLMGLRHARRNLLSAWQDNDYRRRVITFTLVRQPYVVANAPDLVRHVFVDRHDNYDRKSPQMRRALEPLLGDGLFISDGDLWKERRGWCAPAFRNDLLPHFAPVMVETALETAARWDERPEDTPIDMLNEMARLTARIIGRTVFGDDVSEDEAAQVVRGFSEYQQAVDHLDLASTTNLPPLGLLTDPRRRGRVNRSAGLVHEVIDRIVERHRHRPAGARTTLLSLFLAGDGHGKTEGAGGGGCPHAASAARNEAIVMFMAGHETTANALTWCWYLLSNAPGPRARLHAELDAVLAGRDPTIADIPNLPYTRAVFEEAMRLYPPVPLLSRQARGADTVEGEAVAPGTILLVLPWLLHRHELFWDAPEAFRPERFLAPAPRPDPFLYVPFSVGPRVCLGQRFGLTEAILCLATLAQRFDPRVVPGHTVELECRLTLRPRDAMPMTLRPRRPGAAVL